MGMCRLPTDYFAVAGQRLGGVGSSLTRLAGMRCSVASHAGLFPQLTHYSHQLMRALHEEFVGSGPDGFTISGSPLICVSIARDRRKGAKEGQKPRQQEFSTEAQRTLSPSENFSIA